MVYSSSEYRPDYMCLGVGGELYVNSLGSILPSDETELRQHDIHRTQ